MTSVTYDRIGPPSWLDAVVAVILWLAYMTVIGFIVGVVIYVLVTEL
jgi:hypothetical protein